jgi:transcriptional regulator with XRE-family HTH domain
VNDELVGDEGPLLVAAGTPGNRRFGALVKSLRERSGLSPKELAEKADVHVSFVRGIERGAQAPSVASAQPLLACMKEQDRIQWLESGPVDLLVRDPADDRDVAFEFKAKVKGQNRRTDVDPTVITAAALLKLFREVPAVVGRIADEPLAGGARESNEGQMRCPAAADDAALGRVVRLLATADDEMLSRVERLLSDERHPGRSSS